ncbi:hypothetical protein NO1_0696 [Candidatus Termititenax aidoneus]|uniref:Uncharacterized protein n=1 Tax=Termititenax aidoneus TaxID=2218524 RepID=A0A388TA57_TERA1|nr:hypothetical protein NO1_0696 [Candidatus Termititenax aidoneus]
MKKRILLLIILVLAILNANTKIYIGTENDQLIFGIDSLLTQVDGAAGLEVRAYAPKRGIVVNGREYGAKAGKTLYTTTIGGKTRAGDFLKYQHRWSAQEEAISAPHALQLGYGQGDNILSH